MKCVRLLTKKKLHKWKGPLAYAMLGYDSSIIQISMNFQSKPGTLFLEQILV